MLKAVLDAIMQKRGEPGTDKLAKLRQQQKAIAAIPTRVAMASVLVERLRPFPCDEGLDSIDQVAEPLTVQEMMAMGATISWPISKSLVAKLKRSLEAPVEELLARKIIPSGEVLARITPQLTSQVRATGIADPDLRRLYSAIYSAFRKRRSLLLLNLAHQVQMEELPWVAAMEAGRKETLESMSIARSTLEQLAMLTIQSFPSVIFPNKLLQEFSALAKSAGLDLPLVEELAADIFMGRFSKKFVRAAKAAARLLQGTLYERYYSIPFSHVLSFDDSSDEDGASNSSGAQYFGELCFERAKVSANSSRSVAVNGTIIEQQQILTTQNLAVIFDAFDLQRKLNGQLPGLAKDCFRAICQHHRQQASDRRQQLQRLKNSAYAWRQMMFFLALAPPHELSSFIHWAEEHLASHPEEFRERLEPALLGLRHIESGARFNSDGSAEDGRAQRFLGWTVGQHWFLASR
jgi:hypothetical protein